MRFVADQVDDLMYLEKRGVFSNLLDFQFYVFAENWEALLPFSNDSLGFYKDVGQIQDIPLATISYQEIMDLVQAHGRGMTIPTFCKLQFCKNEDLKILTTDPAIMRIAKIEGVKCISPLQFSQEMSIRRSLKALLSKKKVPIHK